MSIGIILLVVLIFGLLVFVHELGHFVAARRSGVEVHEFGFGFPPRIIGKKIGKTVYSINWLPLGGFVKLKGENLNDSSAGSFGAASFWGKTKILFAGVAMNFLAAFVILLGLCIAGLPPLGIDNQYTHGAVRYSEPKQVMAAAVAPDSPAEKAGLKRGEIILRANGQPLENEQDLFDFTKSHAGQTVQLTVPARGTALNQEDQLTVHLRPPDSKDGYLGVTSLQTYRAQYQPLDAVVTAAGLTVQLSVATLGAFGNLISNLFVHAKVSEQVAGPVGIVVLLKNVADFGAAYVLIFVASISISLAVVNALPLPALDGGRWLLAAVQRVTRKQLSEQTEGLVHFAGFAALILLMVVITVTDIKRFG